MYYSQGQPLLSENSWKWFSVNKNKKVDEPHTIFCVINETEEPDGELHYLISSWQETMNEYQFDYDKIFIEKVSFHRGCGDYDYKWYLVGERKETMAEMNLRLNDIKKAEDEANALLEKKRREKEDKEYKEFLKLQAKYGDKK